MTKNKKEIIAIIPARGGSKGIPRKNLIGFCGKPLIAWSIEQAKNSKYIEDVYVSSDDKEILEVSQRFGAKVIPRPKELAADTSSSEDALLHAISYVQDIDNKKNDGVVFLQSTSPIRTNEDIDNAITLFLDSNADSLFSAAMLEDFCVWGKQAGTLKSITYDYKNRQRRQETEKYYLENGSIYIFKPEVLKKFQNRLGGKIVIYPMPMWQSYEIDTAEDIEICEYFMSKRNLKKELYG